MLSTEKQKSKRKCCEDQGLAWCSFLVEMDVCVGNGTNVCYFPCENCLEAGYSLKLFFQLLGYDTLFFFACNLKAFPDNHEEITTISISNRI